MQPQIRLRRPEIVPEVVYRHVHAGRLPERFVHVPAEPHVEQGGTARVALDVEVIEQHVERVQLVPEVVEYVGSYLAEHLGERGRGLEAGAHGQRVEVQANLVFEVRVGAVHHRRTDHHVARPGVAVQQHVEGGHQGHKQTGLVALAEFVQVLAQGCGQLNANVGAAVASHGGAWVVGGQFQYRQRPFEPPAPVRPQLPALFSDQVPALPGGVILGLDGERRQRVGLPAAEGIVQGEHVPGGYFQRPAVGDDVVHRKQQQVPFRGEPQQGNLQQGRLGQVKGTPGVPGRQLPGFRFQVGMEPQIEKVQRKRDRFGRFNDLPQGVVYQHEPRTQAFVALYELVKRPLEGGPVEFTRKHVEPGDRKVALLPVVELAADPKAGLAVRNVIVLLRGELPDGLVGWRAGVPQDLPQLPDRRVCQQVAQADAVTEFLADAGDDLHGLERIAAHLEEGDLAADAFQLQDPFPDPL